MPLRQRVSLARLSIAVFLGNPQVKMAVSEIVLCVIVQRPQTRQQKSCIIRQADPLGRLYALRDALKKPYFIADTEPRLIFVSVPSAAAAAYAFPVAKPSILSLPLIIGYESTYLSRPVDLLLVRV